MPKKFDKTDLNVLNKLIGEPFTDIFKQLDMFIVNFGVGIKYSLHTFVFLRVITEEEILLTCNDEYFTANYNHVSVKVYKKDELHRKSLLRHTVERVKKELKNAVVESVKVMNNADIYIKFDNGVVIESLVDRKSRNFEYYRFIELNPSIEECDRRGIKLRGDHTVVKFNEGIVVVQKSNDDE